MLTKAQVKYIQSLGHKKLREQDGVFVAEGPKLINELLSAGNVRPVALYALPGFAARHASVKEMVEVREQELARLSSLATPNEVVGVFTQPSFDAPSFQNTVSLVLDGVQDPGNLGSIVRSADWFGIRTIVCSRDCADVFSGKVVQSTMGSITRVQVIYADLPAFIGGQELPDLYATTLQGKSIYELGTLRQGMIVIGNESKGIGEALLQQAKHHITIPRKGSAESLNAGVACGIVLSHLVGK